MQLRPLRSFKFTSVFRSCMYDTCWRLKAMHSRTGLDKPAGKQNAIILQTVRPLCRFESRRQPLQRQLAEKCAPLVMPSLVADSTATCNIPWHAEQAFICIRIGTYTKMSALRQNTFHCNAGKTHTYTFGQSAQQSDRAESFQCSKVKTTKVHLYIYIRITMLQFLFAAFPTNFLTALCIATVNSCFAFLAFSGTYFSLFKSPRLLEVILRFFWFCSVLNSCQPRQPEDPKFPNPITLIHICLNTYLCGAMPLNFATYMNRVFLRRTLPS